MSIPRYHASCAMLRELPSNPQPLLKNLLSGQDREEWC